MKLELRFGKKLAFFVEYGIQGSSTNKPTCTLNMGSFLFSAGWSH